MTFEIVSGVSPMMFMALITKIHPQDLCMFLCSLFLISFG